MLTHTALDWLTIHLTAHTAPNAPLPTAYLPFSGDRQWTAAKLQRRQQAAIVPVEFGGNYMDEKMQTLHVEFPQVMAFMEKSQTETIDGIEHVSACDCVCVAACV